MIVKMKNGHTLYQVYLIEKQEDEYEIWVEGQSNPIYENVENVILIFK